MSQSTDLVAQGAAGGLAAFLDGPNAFSELATEYNVPVGDILVFSGNTGQFTFKQEVIEHGTSLVFNILEMKKGWICWKDKKPIDKVLVSVISRERVPSKDELEDHGPYTRQGDGWSEMISVPVRDLEGEYPQMEIGLSSKSGVNALARLGSEFGAKARMHLDEQKRPKLPIVEVSATSFEPKDSPGKKWAPKFAIVGWAGMDELEEIARAQEAAAPEQPAAEQQASPAPAPAPAPASAVNPVPSQPAPAQTGFRAGRVGRRT